MAQRSSNPPLFAQPDPILYKPSLRQSFRIVASQLACACACTHADRSATLLLCVPATTSGLTLCD